MAVSQISYIGTYEAVRHTMARGSSQFSDNHLRSFVAGGCASIVGQTTVVPIDIISQHLQMSGLARAAAAQQQAQATDKVCSYFNVKLNIHYVRL